MIRRLSIILLLFTLHAVLANANDHNDERLKMLVKHFEQKGIDIQPMLNDSRFEYMDGITDRFKNSAEKKIETLDHYKRVVGFEAKKNAIAGFYSKYHQELKNAEAEYGIPKEVIIGILGIESDFGKNAGKYNPFNVYVSMYVEDYRTKWTLAQLEELFEFAETRKVDIMDMKSSYAGAMGFAQFIPTSLNRFWVGTELYQMSNNINSVANYLAHFKDVTGSVEKAVYRYNPSSLYQGAVLALAEEARTIIN